MATNQIPVGLWRIDGRNIVQAPNYDESNLLSMNNAVVATKSPQLAGSYSNIFFNNPSFGGDRGLSAYLAELSIGNALSNKSYYSDYNINHTSPSFTPSQASGSQTANSAGNSSGANSANSASASASGSYAPSSAQGPSGGFGFMSASGRTNPANTSAPTYGISLSGANGTSNYSPANSNPWSLGLGQYGTMGAGAHGGKLSAPKDDDVSGKINSRIALIEKYCDKYGKTVDVAKLRSECAENPEEGLKKCDDILNKDFDQDKLGKMVTKEYEEYNKAKLDAGKQVSEQWVDEISKSGLDRAQLSTAGVTKDTVLDVVGTFMTNEKVHAGRVTMDEVFEKPEVASQLINTLKARADEDLTDENIDDDTKHNIAAYIGSLRDTYDKYQESIEDENKHNDLGFNEVRDKLIYAFMGLEGTLRETEARRNDKIAAKHYGLPDDSSIKFTQQTDRYKEEQDSYNGRKLLSTSI